MPVIVEIRFELLFSGAVRKPGVFSQLRFVAYEPVALARVERDPEIVVCVYAVLDPSPELREVLLRPFFLRILLLDVRRFPDPSSSVSSAVSSEGCPEACSAILSPELPLFLPQPVRTQPEIISMIKTSAIVLLFIACSFLPARAGTVNISCLHDTTFTSHQSTRYRGRPVAKERPRL